MTTREIRRRLCVLCVGLAGPRRSHSFPCRDYDPAYRGHGRRSSCAQPKQPSSSSSSFAAHNTTFHPRPADAAAAVRERASSPTLCYSPFHHGHLLVFTHWNPSIPHQPAHALHSSRSLPAASNDQHNKSQVTTRHETFSRATDVCSASRSPNRLRQHRFAFCQSSKRNIGQRYSYCGFRRTIRFNQLINSQLDIPTYNT